METIEILKGKLISNDQEVLVLCNDYLDQLVEKEKQRGASAESRANIILTASGAASFFLVFFSDKLPDVTSIRSALFTIIYATFTLFLSKSVWYSIKSIRMQSRMTVMADSIFEFQEKNKIDVLKYIISSKIWELRHSIQPNTERLFYVQRAQRSLIVFIALLLLEGIAISIKDIISDEISIYIIVGFISLAIIFFFFGDVFIEKRGIWNHGE